MTSINTKLKLAYDFEAEKKYLHSYQILKSILFENPDNHQAVGRLALLHEKMEWLEPGIELCENYLDLKGESIDIIKIYVHLLIKNSDYEKAVSVIEDIKTDEGPELAFLRGELLYLLKKYDESRIFFQNYINNFKGIYLLPQAHLYLAKSLYQLNRYDDSLNNLKISENLTTQNPEIFALQAEIYLKKGMYFTGFESVRKALKFKKEDFLYNKLAAMILVKMQEFKKADYYIKSCLEKKDTDAEVFSLAGICALNLENERKANIYFRKALELDPESKQAVNNLK